MHALHRTPRPHVSSALVQLRAWVTLAACVLGLCCAAQMLVYAFAACTEVRWTEVRAAKAERNLRVVRPSEPVPVEVGPAPASAAEGTVVGGVRAGFLDKDDAPGSPRRTLSATDAAMARTSGLACGVGTLAAVCLAALTLLGVCVAGGGAVPGVERAVTAGVWSLVLALMTLPWSRLLPELGIPGVFAPYADMTRLLDADAPGRMAMHAQWVAAPLTAMFAALGVLLWFRAGVERGVIVLSPSELDRAVEREVEEISRRGVTSTAPKAVGALNRAIGDGASPAPAGTLNAVEAALETAAALASRPEAAAGPLRRPRIVADEDYKRPI